MFHHIGTQISNDITEFLKMTFYVTTMQFKLLSDIYRFHRLLRHIT